MVHNTMEWITSPIKVENKMWQVMLKGVIVKCGLEVSSYWQGSDTCGPMSATSFLDVLWLRRDLPKTMAPLA